MTGLTVLVTGVTGYVGSAVAGRLAAHRDVDRVIGVDAALPEPAARARLGAAEFARADIRNPIIAKVIEAAGVDTVVHASASSRPAGSAARSMAKEMNVLGTMQLLAACQRSRTVRSLVVRSTSAVYGSSPRDAAVATEATTARSVPATGPARDAIDIEGYVRGFARRRPDVRVAVPRFAEIIGPTIRTSLTRHFSLSPFVPVAAGHDSRIQLVHESDVVAMLEHLVLHDLAGTVNVAGDGAMTVTQAIHRAGRLPLRIPLPALDGVGRGLALLRIGGFSAPQVRSLAQGRVMDTTLLRERFGFVPTFTTLAAFDDFIGRLNPVVDPRIVRAAELRIASTLGLRADADRPWRGRAAGDSSTGTVNGTSDSTDAAGGTTPPVTSSSPAEDGPAVTEELPSAPRRLFSINGDAVRSSPRTLRPGGRNQ